MNYHIISTSKSGHGAIFTNAKEAKEYHVNHPGSVYQVFDRLPAKIPPIGKIQEAVKLPKGPSSGITMFTDGSALNNPGPGGWGLIIQFTDGEIEEYSQGYNLTTNNRMEMMAVIEALETLKDFKDDVITIHSDSQYVINGITKGWAKSWRSKGWKKGDGKPAKNPDLWKQMLDLVDQFPKLSFKWVKGHAGNPMNERADELANGAARGDDLLEDVGYN
jgi:ribonuclease HI